MSHRASHEEITQAQVEYKRKYKPFRPFHFSDTHGSGVAKRMASVITTQNGVDTDDYMIIDDNKVEKYLRDIPKGSKVLLLGTGTGREVLVAKDIGLDAVGLTFGSRNIDFGQEYLGLAPQDQVEGLAEVLPFAQNSFDVVAGFQIFEHTMAPLIFLLEQGRVLKYGGKLILEWPPASGYTYGDNPHHQVCYTPGQARGLFEKAGFKEIQTLYDDLSPVPPEDMWRGDQNRMLVATGIKRPNNHSYINTIWTM